MDYIINTLSNLVHQTAFMSLTWGNYLMIIVALIFLYLAIAHDFEPLLLVPIAFGMLLVNIYPDIMAKPADGSAGGLLYYFFTLDEWAILPSLIFMGVGAMTDFGPLIANPMSFLLGAVRLPPLSPSSVVRTALRRSSCARNSGRRNCSAPSPLRRIPTCRLCRSFSRRS